MVNFWSGKKLSSGPYEHSANWQLDHSLSMLLHIFLMSFFQSYIAAMWPNWSHLKQRLKATYSLKPQTTQRILTLLSCLNAASAGKLIICAPPCTFLTPLVVNACKLSDQNCSSRASRKSFLVVTSWMSTQPKTISSFFPMFVPFPLRTSSPCQGNFFFQSHPMFTKKFPNGAWPYD